MTEAIKLLREALLYQYSKPKYERKNADAIRRALNRMVYESEEDSGRFPAVPLPQDGDFTEWVKREQGKVTLMRQSWAATAKDTAFYDGARRS